MAGASLIDDYVADLDSRLHGHRKVKLDLLTEVRDSLEDAADCYRAVGIPDEDAQRKAVADFGRVSEIAQDYQSELAVAYGSRTLRAILFILPVLHLAWEGGRMIFLGPWEAIPGGPMPSWFIPFAQINDSMAWAVAIATTLALLFGRHMSRRAANSRLIARCVATVAMVTATVALLGNLSIGVASVIAKPVLLSAAPMCWGTSLLALLVLSRLTVMARKAVRFAA
ncbi:permease prefix domain 1-containing protein [Kibdelosporangium phytohabitans]|uniref:Uncharacterized protein n=1 Tax=Kibdelosporangium phytohabitans TaxID=860235 RepID=A0A0N9HTF0_9PSEU|nr:permease prefix domain 1-containing protein [Kibdelosporangium phytohabitans]ALG06666.1 hypothetical protein AOZ06_06770 [Kibdelosporangium phytohabitans]MBE1467880.1 hypothetical protein [Kibdelosporangium phytohabitans]